MHESDHALDKLTSYLVDCVQYHALGLALLNELQRMILCHGWKCVKNVAFSWHCRHCSHTVKKSIPMFIIHEYRLHGKACTYSIFSVGIGHSHIILYHFHRCDMRSLHQRSKDLKQLRIFLGYSHTQLTYILIKRMSIGNTGLIFFNDM